MINAAAVQMDATPTPLENRLERAGHLIAEAARAGAKLIVLPELFNSGYAYDDANYDRAELISGRTVTWMTDIAAQYDVHLMGTILLMDGKEVYNSALLVAPDGELWRYDKNYPFLWERAYFREGKGITVADTQLGKLGMMICWDSAHASQWARYAGQVDAMLIASCPPKLSSMAMVLPDGQRVSTRDLGGAFSAMYTDREYFPDQDMNDQAAWMGVPVIHTVGAGRFRTKLPRAMQSVGGYLASRPDLWKWILRAKEVTIEAGYDQQTKIISANGQVMSRVNSDGDGFTLAEISLADELPEPFTPQPQMRSHPFAYFSADVLGRVLMPGLYRAGLRRRYGSYMAPVALRTLVMGAAVVVGVVIGLVSGRRKDER